MAANSCMQRTSNMRWLSPIQVAEVSEALSSTRAPSHDAVRHQNGIGSMKKATEINTRSLDTIASDINRLGRRNIIEIGELLIEAKAQLEYGQSWHEWINAEFFASEDTAWRWMRVAELCSRFRTVRSLCLA